MSEAILYADPACSKSRAAAAWLEARGIAYRSRDYRREPPGLDELQALHAALGVPAGEMVRHADLATQAPEADPGTPRDDAAWLQLLARHPALLQRPILKVGARAVIARPAERMQALV